MSVLLSLWKLPINSSQQFLLISHWLKLIHIATLAVMEIRTFGLLAVYIIGPSDIGILLVRKEKRKEKKGCKLQMQSALSITFHLHISDLLPL